MTDTANIERPAQHQGLFLMDQPFEVSQSRAELFHRAIELSIAAEKLEAIIRRRHADDSTVDAQITAAHDKSLDCWLPCRSTEELAWPRRRLDGVSNRRNNPTTRRRAWWGSCQPQESHRRS